MNFKVVLHYSQKPKRIKITTYLNKMYENEFLEKAYLTYDIHSEYPIQIKESKLNLELINSLPQFRKI